MVIPAPPPINFDPNEPMVNSTSTKRLWKPKMKYKYSLNAFCGCSDYIIGEEEYTFNDYATDALVYMRAAYGEQLFEPIKTSFVVRAGSDEAGGLREYGGAFESSISINKNKTEADNMGNGPDWMP